MKLLTFCWSTTVVVEETFDRSNNAQLEKAINQAWSQVDKMDGELTDVQDQADENEIDNQDTGLTERKEFLERVSGQKLKEP
jgi:hypothetical protein